MRNEKKMEIMQLWRKVVCVFLFLCAGFLLSGYERSLAEEEEQQEEVTKEEAVAEKKRKLACVKDEGKFIIHAKRLSDSKVKLDWKNVDDDFVYYVYNKNADGQKKLLGKTKKDSYVLRGCNAQKKYKLSVEIYYAWQGESVDEKQHSSIVCAGRDGMSRSVTENIYMGKSLPLTFTTGKGHFMNVKKIQTKKESVVLEKKQMHCVRCRIWLNNGKLVYGKPKLYYYSTVPSVAVVDKYGCVTAKKKGSSVIFVMAPNGVYDKVSVEVK